jgi:hypothetical protein
MKEVMPMQLVLSEDRKTMEVVVTIDQKPTVIATVKTSILMGKDGSKLFFKMIQDLFVSSYEVVFPGKTAQIINLRDMN